MSAQRCPNCGAGLKAEILGDLCPQCGLGKVMAEPDGTFTTTTVGTFNRMGSTINLTGSLNN